MTTVDTYVGPSCDQCDRPFTKPRRTVRYPRPSDPHDLCGVMWLCQECAPESSESCKTEAEWDEYIESPEALRAGHWWLT